VPAADKYSAIISSALHSGQQTGAIVYLTGRREDSVNATAIPLKNETGNVLAVLTVVLSRADMVAAQTTGHVPRCNPKP
jgi:two-component system, NtrC family, nitrogen regulation sensor histidine kinase NtrY